MKKALLVLGILILFSSMGLAVTRTVTNCANDGVGSLRFALASAEASDIIVFDITTTEAGYSSGEAFPGLVTTEAGSDTWFRIITNSSLPDFSYKSNITIAGSTQTREATNTKGPKVEIRANGNHDVTNLLFGVDDLVIEGLAINRCNSGDPGYGIRLREGTDRAKIYGCYIGTTATGEAAAPNGHSQGISLTQCTSVEIGGDTPAKRNIISNNTTGVDLYGGGGGGATVWNYTIVKGNYIGVNRTGVTAIPNTSYGVFIGYGSSGNIVGGVTSVCGSGEGNVISGNTVNGIMINADKAISNYVMGNLIGTNATGSAAIANGANFIGRGGIKINASPRNTIVGNIISGNNQDGIYIDGANAIGNVIKTNYIGTNISGTGSIANINSGVRIYNAANQNVIGSTESGGRNIISGNDQYGIEINAGSSNEVLGNYLGVKANGIENLGNALDGICIRNGSKFNKVGNGAANGRNYISGNSSHGIRLANNDTNSNEVFGNFIGTDITGTVDLGNSGHGVFLDEGPDYNLIGNGTAAGLNLISGNTNDGINLDEADHNSIRGNLIGTNITGTSALSNGGDGIQIASQAKYNAIGGAQSGETNLISGNSNCGIFISSAGTGSNEVIGNLIGTALDGVSNLGNTQFGILINGTSSNNLIGTSNIIAYNGNASYPAGIKIDGTGTDSNEVTYNSIFSNYGAGILVSAGANRGIASPEITSTSYNQLNGLLQVTGTATPGARVEIYKSQGNQGKTYVGTLYANGSGAVSGSMTYSGLVSGDALTATQTDPYNDSSEFSASKEVSVTTAFMRQPDLAIDISAAGTDYKTIGVYENTPSTQVQSRSVATNEAAVFYFKTVNAGNTGDTIQVSGEGSSGAYTIKYFGSKTGTVEVTMPISSPMASAESGERRVEITYNGNTIATKEIIVTATTTNDSTKKDSIKAIATFVPLPSPTPTEHATQEFTESQLGVPGMHITIPSGATTVDVTVTATVITAPSAPPAGYSVGGQTFNIVSTPVNTFLIPVTVTIPIIGPLTFPKVYYWDGTKWSTEGITVVSYTTTSLTFTTTHFTIFAPMATLATNRVRFGPNPYNPNNGSGHFWYLLDADTDTTIYLIDLAGTVQFKQTYTAGTNGGKKDENNIAYDGKSAWGDQLGQGVYIYKIVQGGKAIGGGKIAVVK